MQRTGLSCLGLLASFGLLLASCGGPEATGDPSGADAPSAESADEPGALAFDEEPASGASTTPTSRPRGDEVRLALARPPSLLPGELSPADQAAVIAVDLLYDGLTEAVVARSELRPALASSWSASDDLTTWTFELDLDRITPDAVVEHFLALRASATGSVAAVVAPIEQIEAVGDGVRFTLDRPVGGFAWLLSGVGMSVVGADGSPTGRHAVVVDDETTLELRSRVDGVPDVTVVWDETPRDAYNRLTLGSVDAAVAPPDALADASRRFGSQPPARAITRFYGINTASARLDDPRLVEALLLAVDRQAIVDEVIAVPAFALDGLLAPNLAGYARTGCGRACRPDGEEAASLVAAVLADASAAGAPSPGGPEIRIAVTADQAPVAASIAEQLADAGFAPTVTEYEPAELAAVIGSGEVELYAAGWIAPATSLDAVVPPLLDPEGAVGLTVGGTPEVAETLALATQIADDDARWQLLIDAHDEAMNRGAALPIAIATGQLVVSPQSPDLPTRADGSIDLVAVE